VNKHKSLIPKREPDYKTGMFEKEPHLYFYFDEMLCANVALDILLYLKLDISTQKIMFNSDTTMGSERYTYFSDMYNVDTAYLDWLIEKELFA